MGKISKLFKTVLGFGPKSDPNPKKIWSLLGKDKATTKSKNNIYPSKDATKHAYSDDTATAVAVLRPRNRRASKREEWAAITIQSYFRGYLSRRALRALKALVKLQALVKGCLLRKQTTSSLRQMEAIARVQARARAHRVLSTIKSSSIKDIPMQRDCSKPKGYNSTLAGLGNGAKPYRSPVQRNMRYSPGHLNSNDRSGLSSATLKASTAHRTTVSSELLSVFPLKLEKDSDDTIFHTANNTPQYYSPSSISSAFTTPLRNRTSGYSDHPNYMAYTVSSKAKARSVSAPKQRGPHQYERSSSMKGSYVHRSYGYSTPNNCVSFRLS